MNYVDYQIMIVLVLFAIYGFRKGFLKMSFSLVGLVLVIVASFYLKNPLAVVLYEKLPFFSLKGLTVFNILIYEGIAFLIVFSILMLIYKIALSLVSILNKGINFILFLGIPSKILGMILGVIEGIVFVFIVFFVMLQFNYKTNDIISSKYGSKILSDIPILSKTVEDAYSSMKEIYDLNKKYEDKEEYNKAVFEMMLDKKILSTNSANKLIYEKKLKINGADEIIAKYEKEK